MSELKIPNFVTAISDFRAARRKASLERILAKITGKAIDLLSYDEVRQMLQGQASSNAVLKEIPIDAIIGSVGRYTDFTRSFLPTQDSDASRWATVKSIIEDMRGLPPIEVYQIGEAYFVIDGNHRVSIAHQMGAKHIQAYVREVKTRVALTPQDSSDDLILKAEYASFLENTRIDEIRPDVELTLTMPGKYAELEEHIEIHRYLLGLKQKREIPYRDAVGNWYDHVYMPMIQTVRATGVLCDFPDRTETDLYLWVSEHRTILEEELGMQIKSVDAARDLANKQSSVPGKIISRISEVIKESFLPDELDFGPATGEWRKSLTGEERQNRLFSSILVPVSGEESGWNALEQAINVAQREKAKLHGLHILENLENSETASTRDIQEEFTSRSRASHLDSNFIVGSGNITKQICDRARWTDLVVLSLKHPPVATPLSKLSSGFSAILRRCAPPILSVPGKSTSMNHALLAYDGSPRSREALYISAYLTARWGIELSVIQVTEGVNQPHEMLVQALAYLENKNIFANPIAKSGKISEAILESADENGCDLILLGGYGLNNVLDVVLGSVVDQILRTSTIPVLVCR